MEMHWERYYRLYSVLPMLRQLTHKSIGTWKSIVIFYGAKISGDRINNISCIAFLNFWVTVQNFSTFLSIKVDFFESIVICGVDVQHCYGDWICDWLFRDRKRLVLIQCVSHCYLRNDKIIFHNF